MFTLNNTVYLGKAMPASSGTMPTFGKVIIKSSSIPTASADNAGYMYIYDGVTNGTYTHGYIYENKYVPSYTGTVTFTPSTVTVSDTDFSAFLNEWKHYISAPLTVTHGTFTYDTEGNLWRMVFLNASDEQVGVIQLYQEDYEDAGFTFTGTFSDGDVLTFVSTISAGASSYQWVRIDVQPGGGSVIFVPELPAQGEQQYIYGVVLSETTRDGYGIIQLFMWYNNNWYAAGAFDVDIDPSQLVYKDNIPYATSSLVGGIKQSFDSTTSTWTVITEEI